jgi:hypothetical protein
MRKSPTLVVACVASLIVAGAAGAQPRGHDDRGRPQPQFQHGPPPGGPGPSQYYYNGRWVGPDEWQRHNAERDRWARDYDRRRHRDDSSAIVAGILGFALGAAIVGSAQQADKARTADQSWDAYCARKYRSYDRHSRTYLGSDGLRHYCQ